MSTKNKAGLKSLKFKITSKGIRNDLEEISFEETMKNRPRNKVHGVNNELFEVNITSKPTTPSISRKRGPEASSVNQSGKLRKMDRRVKSHCGSILRELMNSNGGTIFNKPVDPVVLRIPDYFSIISQPMDLGTIKEKLEGNLYFSRDEFAGDVKLTFSNAMLYNPPGHYVHKLAKRFNSDFCKKWKLLDAKWKQANMAIDMERDIKIFKKTVDRDSQASTQFRSNMAPLHVNPISNRVMPLEEKQKLRLEVLELSTGKMMQNLRTVFDEFGLTGVREDMLHSFIDSADDKTLWKLKREIKGSVCRRGQQVEPRTMAQNGHPLAGKCVPKGTEKHNQTVSAATGVRRSIDSTGAKCSCRNWSCGCHVQSAAALASSSDISSDRSQELGHHGVSKFDFEVRCPVSPHGSRLGPDFDESGVVVNEEDSPCLSTPSTTAASSEGWISFNIQMSPKKALRAAMLKSRFADTIFRATHGGKTDRAQMQQERERLERELEEKAKIEKEIKAAEVAMHLKVQAELKMQREREREAARIALLKVEKTVEVDENLQILKDLEILCCGSPPEDGCVGIGTGHSGNPLERLGLYMKNDYLDEDEDPILNGEDGEILL